MMWVKLDNDNTAKSVVVSDTDQSQPGFFEVTDMDFELAREGCMYDNQTGRFIPKQHFTLDAIPLPATAIIEDEQYELTDQPTFEFSEPGEYEVTINAGPAYYVETFTVDYPASS